MDKTPLLKKQNKKEFIAFVPKCVEWWLSSIFFITKQWGQVAAEWKVCEFGGGVFRNGHPHYYHRYLLHHGLAGASIQKLNFHAKT